MALPHNPGMTTPRHLLGYTLLALGLASIAFGALARGDVYKWTDSKGNVHYEDRNSGNPSTIKLQQKSPLIDPSSLADLEVVRNGDASEVYVSNRLGGPIEVNLALTEAQNVIAEPALPLRQLLPARARVLISRILPGPGDAASYAVGMSAMPGDPKAIPDDVVYALPMDESSNWQVGQGFHGGFSHEDEQNRYAVDLVVPTGTPILAARDGVVMQVESGFDRSGLNHEKYAQRANLVRVLHSDGSMAVYAHLQENGVYVRVGERVHVGQQIALSGNTGYSSGPHLHFCIQINTGMRLVSIPFRMVTSRGFLPMKK
jgi:murein DD-endopeptidase MepM/ murein hydrolase activator NlpD